MPANRSRRNAENAISVVSVRDVPAPDEYDFWLVQNLIQRNLASKTGFNSKFELEYMGSAEFEFGAVSKSLRRIHEAGDIVIAAADITRLGVVKTVYFVGPLQQLDEKVADFRVWFNGSRLESKEMTYFDTLFTEDFPFFIRRSHISINAWWSLDDDIAWTLDINIAQSLLEGFMPPAN